MVNLNQIDINERLQRLACCIATKVGSLNFDLINGRKICTVEDIEELDLLTSYYDILSCYNIIQPCVNPTATMTYSSGSNGTITIVIAGISIGTVFWSVNSDTTNTNIVNLINSTTATTGFSAAKVGGGITITSNSCSAILNGSTIVTTNSRGNVVYNNTPFTGGVNAIVDGDNCILEVDAQNMFEQASILCDICFATPGTTYLTQ